MMERLAFAAAVAAAGTLALGGWTIPRLRQLHVEQAIRDEAPQRHQAKAGTPTMGGVIILTAVVITAFAVLGRLSPGVVFALVVMLGYGLVGGLDDLLKIRRRRNLGLRARERLAVQILIAGLVAWYVARQPERGTALVVPGLGAWDLGRGYVIFAILYIVGFANAVNESDGLDGLAAGTVAIASSAYAAIALRTGQPDLGMLAAILAGACLGFLWFNAHPAVVMMGDVGSNALGAGLAAIAIMTKTEVVLFIVGLVFVLEAASVLLQVAYFKSTGGRRIFRMSPLHHHFELTGWTEPQTVTRLWLVGLAGALLGLVVIF